MKRVEVVWGWKPLIGMLAMYLIMGSLLAWRTDQPTWQIPMFVLLCVLGVEAHEGGHALMANATGSVVQRVSIGWGARVRIVPSSANASAAIAITGPIASMVFGVILSQGSGLVVWAGLVAALDGLVNLLPIKGSDGQRLWADMHPKVSHLTRS